MGDPAILRYLKEKRSLEVADRSVECHMVEIRHPLTGQCVEAFCTQNGTRLLPASAIAKNGSFTETSENGRLIALGRFGDVCLNPY